MVDSWSCFFDLVHSVTKEVEMKVESTASVNILESLCNKVEHCLQGVLRIADSIIFLPMKLKHLNGVMIEVMMNICHAMSIYIQV